MSPSRSLTGRRRRRLATAILGLLLPSTIHGGDFSIPPPDPHQGCQKALSIPSLPFFHTGDTSDALLEADPSDTVCPILQGNYRGAWFLYFSGKEECVTVRAHDADFDIFDPLDPRLGVYRTPQGSQNCTDLTCVAMNDDIATTRVLDSQVQFTTQLNASYYIVMAGFGAGPFQLNVTSLPGPCDKESTTSLCDFCPDGRVDDSPFSSPPYSDELTCDAYQEMEIVSRRVADTEDCRFLQLEGAIQCGCAKATNDTCFLCPNGARPVHWNKTYGKGGLMCRDFYQIPAIFGPDTCTTVTSYLASYCGCPGVPPPCGLCGSQELPNPNLTFPVGPSPRNCAEAQDSWHEYPIFNPSLALNCQEGRRVWESDLWRFLNISGYCCDASLHPAPTMAPFTMVDPPSMMSSSSFFSKSRRVVSWVVGGTFLLLLLEGAWC